MNDAKIPSQFSEYDFRVLKELIKRADMSFVGENLEGDPHRAGLYEAAAKLLDFVRQRYPEDFKEGGRGFTCPFHQALHAAVLRAERELTGE